MGALEERPTYLDVKLQKEVPIPEESTGYFSLIHKILRESYENNDDNDENFRIARERKSFTRANANMDDDQETDYIHWLDYLYNELYNGVEDENNKWEWAQEMIDALDKEVFLNENKFQSNLFYKNFLIQTCPKIIKPNEEEEAADIYDSANNENQNTGAAKNNFTELSVTENLGGSFLSMNTSDLMPDDPAIEYKQSRANCKEYVKVLADHLNNYPDHPINVVLNLFQNAFSKKVKEKTEALDKEFKAKIKSFQNHAHEVSDMITRQLQKFIITLQTAVKLFYCKVIDYECFSEEKDEIINLMTSLVYKKQKIYDCMYSLYELDTAYVKQNLEKKFVDLENATPEDLGIDIKFCLNSKTLEQQKKILAEKRLEKDKKEKEKELEEKKKKEEEKKVKENSELGVIGENEDEKEEDEEEKDEVNKSDIIITTKLDTSNATDKKDDLSNNPLYGNKYDRDSINFMNSRPSRLSVQSFNNKQFNFPKLHQNLRDTIGRQNFYVSNALQSDKIPKSYASAIELLRSIRRYRTPFEKMMIIASISDEITECVNNFWNDMNKYIKSTFLNIEADELMTIFLFIIIKSGMPELTIHAKMIKNFTSSTTRGTMIGYYYTTLEASIAYIEELKDTNELVKQKEQLATARFSLAPRVSQLNMSGYK